MTNSAKKIILTSPCLPKKTFHCGNAVSQIIPDILFSFFVKYNIDSKFLFVQDAWNLHGLPFEKMYIEKQVGTTDTTYTEIRLFSEECVSFAKLQKNLFSTVYKAEEVVTYYDTDSGFVEYCASQCRKLVELGYVKQVNAELVLDFSLIHQHQTKNALSSISVYPNHYKKTIENDVNMIDGYSITKKRLFAPQINILGESYSINPIFQSFLYPSYICQKAGCEYPAFIQVSGTATLKWHFIRNIISRVLFGVPAYHNLILHGSVLGADGKRMSKHSLNIVQPSDLHSLIPDKRFVRHVLIKSISERDVSLQTDASYNEFIKIKDTLNQIQKGYFCFLDPDKAACAIASIKEKLSDFKVKQAFEEFYLLVRSVNKQDRVIDKVSPLEDFIKLYEIFYGDIK